MEQVAALKSPIASVAVKLQVEPVKGQDVSSGSDLNDVANCHWLLGVCKVTRSVRGARFFFFSEGNFGGNHTPNSFHWSLLSNKADLPMSVQHARQSVTEGNAAKVIFIGVVYFDWQLAPTATLPTL